MIKHYFDTIWLSIIGGICITLGGCAYLLTENNTVGAILFTVGLFTICTMNFNLFTGKVAYTLDNKPKYIIDLILIWIGNFLGTGITTLVLGYTRHGIKLQEKATVLCNTKLSDTPLSMFILAIFCNILIYIAVESYKANKHEVGKYLGLLFGVVVFIFCGFEHSVADMFYFNMAGMWSTKMFLYLMIVSLGNAVGGLLIPVFKKIHNKLI